MEASHLVCQFPLISSEELVLLNPILCELSCICCYGTVYKLLDYHYIYSLPLLQITISLVINRTFPDRLCTPSTGCHSTLSYCSVSEPALKSVIGSTVSSTFGPDVGWGCGPTIGFPLSFSAFPLIGKKSNSTATIPIQVIKICWAINFIKIHMIKLIKNKWSMGIEIML